MVKKILAVSEVEGFFGVCGIGFSDDVEFYKGRTRSWGHLMVREDLTRFPPHDSLQDARLNLLMLSTCFVSW